MWAQQTPYSPRRPAPAHVAVQQPQAQAVQLRKTALGALLRSLPERGLQARVEGGQALGRLGRQLGTAALPAAGFRAQGPARRGTLLPRWLWLTAGEGAPARSSEPGPLGERGGSLCSEREQGYIPSSSLPISPRHLPPPGEHVLGWGNCILWGQVPVTGSGHTDLTWPVGAVGVAGGLR